MGSSNKHRSFLDASSCCTLALFVVIKNIQLAEGTAAPEASATAKKIFFQRQAMLKFHSSVQ